MKPLPTPRFHKLSLTKIRAFPRVLIFNQPSRPEARDLLEGLHRSFQTVKFDHVVFCTNVTRKATGYRRGIGRARKDTYPSRATNYSVYSDFVNLNNDPSSVANLTVQTGFLDVWKDLEPSLPTSNIHLLPNIQEAVELIDEFSDELGEVQIFVTGSLHLVGGIISILEGVSTPVAASMMNVQRSSMESCPRELSLGFE